MALTVMVRNQTGVPIYEQIMEQIKACILSGEAAEGELLPSIRQLASDLKVSAMTTTRAYAELEREGFLITVQGKGCYVAPIESDLVHEQLLRTVEENLAAAIKTARLAQMSHNDLRDVFEFMMKGEDDE